jgi:hypothetical protein
MTEDEMMLAAMELSRQQEAASSGGGGDKQPTTATTSTTTTAGSTGSSGGSGSGGTLSGDELLNLLEKTVNQEMLQELRSMEFSRLRSVKALLSTNSKSLEAACEWLVIHQDDKDIDEPLQQVQETPEQTAERLQKEQQRMKDLIAQKKKDKEEQAKREQIELEKQRREFGKKAVQQQDDFQRAQKERDRMAARLEKEENDKRLKQLREQQELRRQEALKGKQDTTTTSTSTSTSTTSTTSSTTTNSSSSSEKKEFTECTLQIKLLDGSSVTEKFPATDTLQSVKNWVQGKSGKSSFNLMTNFPKKVYKSSDLKQSLKEAGLCPRGQLICTLGE